MTITDFPIPNVTPPNWGQQLIDAITDRIANLQEQITSTLPFKKVEEYGAVGDGTTDDTAAIQDGIDDLNAIGGGVLMFTQNKTYRGAVILKDRVLLMGPMGDTWAEHTDAKPILKPPTGWAGGYVIDSEASPLPTSAGVIGLAIDGGMTSSSSPDTGGIRIKGGPYGAVLSNKIYNVSLSAIRLDGGVAWWVGHNQCATYFPWRDTYPLTDHDGVIHIEGTDHIIFHNVANSLRTADDSAVPSSGDVEDIMEWGHYIDVLTSWIIQGASEFNLGGWNIRMYQGLGTGMRADTNPGPGFYFRQSSSGGGTGGNHYSGLRCLANCGSPNADDKYAHIITTAYNDTYDGIMLGANWTGDTNAPAYGIWEAASWSGFSGLVKERLKNVYSNLQSVHNSVAPAWTRQEIVADVGAVSYKQPGNWGDMRPHAYYCTGKTVYDSTLAKAVISDGVRWRCVDNGKIASSFIRLTASEFTGGATSDWAVYASTSTLSLVYENSIPSGRSLELSTTSAGVTAGYAAAQTTGGAITSVVPIVGATYKASLYAKGPSGKSPTGDVILLFFNSSFGVIGGSSSAPVSIGSGSAAATLVSSGAVAAPAGSAYMGIVFQGRATGLAAADKFQIAFADIQATVLP